MSDTDQSKTGAHASNISGPSRGDQSLVSPERPATTAAPPAGDGEFQAAMKEQVVEFEIDRLIDWSTDRLIKLIKSINDEFLGKLLEWGTPP